MEYWRRDDVCWPPLLGEVGTLLGVPSHACGIPAYNLISATAMENHNCFLLLLRVERLCMNLCAYLSKR